LSTDVLEDAELVARPPSLLRSSASAPPGELAIPTKPGLVTISGNDGDDLRAGTRASILRQAGLKGSTS